MGQYSLFVMSFVFTWFFLDTWQRGWFAMGALTLWHCQARFCVPVGSMHWNALGHSVRTMLSLSNKQRLQEVISQMPRPITIPPRGWSEIRAAQYLICWTISQYCAFATRILQVVALSIPAFLPVVFCEQLTSAAQYINCETSSQCLTLQCCKYNTLLVPQVGKTAKWTEQNKNVEAT